MVEYKFVKRTEIDSNFLNGFVREQLTEKVMYLENGRLLEKEDVFLESWDSKKLIELSQYIKSKVEVGGVLLACYSDLRVIGFALLEAGLFNNGYINLDYIHVTKDYRNQGIGRKLFENICKEAKRLGASKLYISGHPNIYTQKFYQSMGCVLAKEINERLFLEEPQDIHLEKVL